MPTKLMEPALWAANRKKNAPYCLFLIGQTFSKQLVYRKTEQLSLNFMQQIQ
ncbi:hypothetical protein Hanom_Chr02g00149881 [Helianthus anomalus]